MIVYQRSWMKVHTSIWAATTISIYLPFVVKECDPLLNKNMLPALLSKRYLSQSLLHIFSVFPLIQGEFAVTVSFNIIFHHLIFVSLLKNCSDVLWATWKDLVVVFLPFYDVKSVLLFEGTAVVFVGCLFSIYSSVSW